MGKDLITFFSSWPFLFTSSFYGCLWVISPSILIWNIWLECNNRIFRNTISSLPEVLLKIESSISKVALSHISKNLENLTSFSHWDSRVTRVWRMLSILTSLGAILKKGDALNKRKLASWKPPPLGKFKLNFDGASCGNLDLAGVGMMIFYHHIYIIQARCHTIGTQTNNFFEFKALSLGLELAISLGIKDLIIKGDSLVIIQSLLKRNSHCWQLQYLLDHILQQLEFFDSFFITHCYREINTVADFLANLAIDSNANLCDVNSKEIHVSVLKYLQ